MGLVPYLYLHSSSYIIVSQSYILYIVGKLIVSKDVAELINN